MKKFFLAGGVALLLVVGILVLVLSNVNSIIKTTIEVVGSAILQAPVEVKDVNVSFLSGSGEITGLKVGNPADFSGDYAFYVDKLLIELDVGSIDSDKLHIKDILIDSPSIIFEGNLTHNNLKTLQRNAEEYSSIVSDSDEPQSDSTEQSGGQSAGQLVRIDHLAVKDANIGIVMSFLGGESLSVTLPSLELVDLGKEEDLTAAEVLQKIIGSLNRSIVPLVRSNTEDMKSQLKEKGEEIKNALDEGVEKLKQLFRDR